MGYSDTPSAEGKRSGAATMALAPVHWRGLHVFSRDIDAEKAQAMFRRGLGIEEVAEALGRKPQSVRELARDYGLVIPSLRPSNWPDRDDPGDPTPSYRPKARQHGKPVARALPVRTSAVASLPVDPWPRQAPPVCYDDCVQTVPPKTGGDIIRAVCLKHGISSDALVGRHRKAEICAARHEAAFRMIVELGYSYPRAGRVLGGRDHTTILNSVKRHAASSPEAMAAYRTFCRVMAESDEVMRAKAIQFHFDDAASVNDIMRRLPVSRNRVMAWLLDEADRRREAA